MNYQDITEAAFLDELEKIGGWGSMLAGAGKKLTELGGKQFMGNTLKTHAMRAAVGAVPGALAGAAAAEPGHRFSGALKGGVVGGAAGAVGGKLLERRALGNLKGYAAKGPLQPHVQQAAEAIRGQALPGL
jgi:hypothetical protein